MTTTYEEIIKLRNVCKELFLEICKNLKLDLLLNYLNKKNKF
jgi:hypothetical protein